MKKYEIWSEGWAATGDGGGAQCHGVSEGRSFREACENLFDNNEYFDKKNLTFWGCALFKDEKKARKSFG